MLLRPLHRQEHRRRRPGQALRGAGRVRDWRGPPVSIHVTTFGTGRVSDEMLEKLVRAHFDCRPAALIRELDLLRPIYRATAAYGHFGRSEPGFTWEKTTKAAALRDAARSAAA